MLHLLNDDRMCFGLSPNKHMQRSERHKVLGRGRSGLGPSSTPRARVLIGQRAGADAGR